MSHQLFETWLLSEEPLEPDQAAALHAHLESCESCRNLSTAWSEVRSLFSRSKPAEPAPGFSARWQQRLTVQQAGTRFGSGQEVSIIFIGVTAGIALILMFAILAVGFLIFTSPARFLLTGLYSLGNLINSLNAVGNIIAVMKQVLPEIVPANGWIVFIALAGLLSLAWTYLLRRILVPRRITT